MLYNPCKTPLNGISLRSLARHHHHRPWPRLYPLGIQGQRLDVGRGLRDAIVGHRALLPERPLCRLRHGVLLPGHDRLRLHRLDAAQAENAVQDSKAVLKNPLPIPC